MSDDFVIDDESWAIRYLIVDTRNWFPGKKVLVSPQWIRRVSWSEAKTLCQPVSRSHQTFTGNYRRGHHHPRLRDGTVPALQSARLLGKGAAHKRAPLKKSA